MISIKRFLEQRQTGALGQPERELIAALSQMVRLLLDAIAANMVRGRDADLDALQQTLLRLGREMGGPQTPISLLGISSDATEALETYYERTSDYLRQQREQMQSMLSMLADTVTELSGQTDATVGRLQSIERAIETASGLQDMRALRSSLADCLAALREAAIEERASSGAAMERLQARIDYFGDNGRRHHPAERAQGSSEDDVDLAPEPDDEPSDPSPTSYVAAFKLQRAEHIASRFGEAVRHQMMAMVGTRLKSVLGPADRLVRWKGTAFVMFLNSAAPIHEIRVRLADAIAATGQQYIEVGRKSALLSVGVDWIVFPQSDRPSLEAVFTEVDAFLSAPSAVAQR